MLTHTCDRNSCTCRDGYEIEEIEIASFDSTETDPWLSHDPPVQKAPQPDAEPAETAKALGDDSKIHGVVIGKLVGLTESDEPIVDYPGNPSATPIVARTTAMIKDLREGQDVAMLFEAGYRTKPVVIGPVVVPQTTNDPSQQTTANPPAEPTTTNAVSVQADEDNLTLSANRQITLRCGRASITLTRAGKVLIRGAYLLNRSSGVNKVKGGSVQIN